jgi:hypothetical protein
MFTFIINFKQCKFIFAYEDKMVVSGKFHTIATLPLGKKIHGVNSIQGWVGLSADLDKAEKRKI